MLDWTDEQKMLRDAIRSYVDNEIVPRRDELEHGDLPPYEILRKMSTTFGIDEMARDASPDNSNGRAATGGVARTRSDARPLCGRPDGDPCPRRLSDNVWERGKHHPIGFLM